MLFISQLMNINVWKIPIAILWEKRKKNKQKKIQVIFKLVALSITCPEPKDSSITIINDNKK